MPLNKKPISSKSQVDTKYKWFEGHGKLSERLWRDIDLAASTAINVLIVGETGVGKEVVARWIHDKRLEKQGLIKESAPFVSTNCAAIPDSLLESILFGHERGAFTSARDLQRGKFELAKEGTLFLDEIQHLNLSAQSKLLRVLQHKEFERLGAKNTKEIKCQIISATNIPLEILADKKQFRKDLYYRLNVCPIYLPALRHRKEDLPNLIKFFLKKIEFKYQLQNLCIEPCAYTRLFEYSWPGNLRELEHSLVYASLRAKGKIKSENLPAYLTGKLDKFLEEGKWAEASF